MTQTMTSPKHENWTIYKDTVAGQVSWSMQHKSYPGYLVEVTQNNGQWMGQILTEQKIEGLPGEMEWLPAQNNPMYDNLEDVKTEVIKRGEYWNRK